MSMRPSRIAFALLTVALVIVAGVAIYAAVAVNTQPTENGDCEEGPESRCCRERAHAIHVWHGFNNAVNLLTANPTLSTQIIANYFSPYGIWSVPFQAAPIVGPTEVYNFFIGYALNPGETNQTVVDKQLNWDCLTRTLSVQRIWYATLTQPRAFTPGSAVTLPAGTTYSQDDFVAMRFNCNFTRRDGFNSIVYYREYFDNTQFEATYTDLLSPVCPPRYLCPVMQ